MLELLIYLKFVLTCCDFFFFLFFFFFTCCDLLALQVGLLCSCFDDDHRDFFCDLVYCFLCYCSHVYFYELHCVT